MSKSIRLTITVDEVSGKAVLNSVRRAFGNADASLFSEGTGSVKGVKFSVKDAPQGPAEVKATAVRAWAIKQGLPVGKRGRVSADLVAAYDAKH